jgi:hypothetical protein
MESLELKARIIGMAALNRPHSFIRDTMSPFQPKIPPPDTDWLTATILPEENPEAHSSIVLKTQDAKRLNLMIGDVLTLRVSKG